MRIGILTAGGDAPGMNAIVDSLRDQLSGTHELVFFQNSYQGLVQGNQFFTFFSDSWRYQPGSILGSIRYPEFSQSENQLLAVANFNRFRLDKLIVIGGDGTLKGAEALRNLGIDVTFIPATIDNDLPYETDAVGFASALQEIVEDGKKLWATIQASHGVCFMEIMGRTCDDLLVNAAQALNASLVLPDVKTFSDDGDLVRALVRLAKHQPAALILVRENHFTDAIKHRLIQTITNEVFTSVRWTVLGHLQRGAVPVAWDLILAFKIAGYVRAHLLEQNLTIAIHGREITRANYQNKKSCQTDLIPGLNQVWRIKKEEK